MACPCFFLNLYTQIKKDRTKNNLKLNITHIIAIATSNIEGMKMTTNERSITMILRRERNW